MPQSEKEQIGEYLWDAWNALAKFHEEFMNGRYPEARGLERQAALEQEIDLWHAEMLLLIKVGMLGDILGIDTNL